MTVSKQEPSYKCQRSTDGAPLCLATIVRAMGTATRPLPKGDVALHPAREHARFRVLLVEDQAAVRAVTQRMLERAGYATTAIDRPLKALALLDSSVGPRPDAAVLDLLMPEMNGVTLAWELRRRLPDVPIVFVSGYPGQTLHGWPAGDRGSLLLPKPFTISELGDALQTVLGLR